MSKSKENEKIEEGIKDIFSGILSSVDEDADQYIKEFLVEQDVDEGYFKDPDLFFHKFIYPFETRFLGGLIRTYSKNDDVRWILTHPRFIANHFNNLFEQIEGSVCSVDKGRTVVRALLKYYATGEEIKFNYDGEYTYHLPKTILKKHDEIVGFYEGLQNLYYGSPKKYLLAMQEIGEQVQALKDKEKKADKA